jgi:hypothetical protein
MALSAGTRFGPHEILAPIGAGGMGEVCRAKYPKLAREVAINILPEARGLRLPRPRSQGARVAKPSQLRADLTRWKIER